MKNKEVQVVAGIPSEIQTKLNGLNLNIAEVPDEINEVAELLGLGMVDELAHKSGPYIYAYAKKKDVQRKIAYDTEQRIVYVPEGKEA